MTTTNISEADAMHLAGGKLPRRTKEKLVERTDQLYWLFSTHGYGQVSWSIRPVSLTILFAHAFLTK